MLNTNAHDITRGLLNIVKFVDSRWYDAVARGYTNSCDRREDVYVTTEF